MAFLISSRLFTDFFSKVFLLLNSRTVPVFSNYLLNFFNARSIFSPSLIGTMIITITPPFIGLQSYIYFFIEQIKSTS